jgi:pseudouridine-5'-phosphate glycosidase/pseudouridine kinase
VFGSLAVDLSCDYSPENHNINNESELQSNIPAPSSPRMQTSNIANITPSIGGVGHNVALAAHRVAGNLKVKLCSRVADDL